MKDLLKSLKAAGHEPIILQEKVVILPFGGRIIKRTGKKYSYVFVFNYHGMDMDTVIGTQLNNREICVDLHLRS